MLFTIAFWVVLPALAGLYFIDNQKITKYQIVSEFEANIDDGLISYSSPVARALIGKEVGDEIEITTPGGVVNYEILKIEYKI